MDILRRFCMRRLWFIVSLVVILGATGIAPAAAAPALAPALPLGLSLIHISEPTRPYSISYAVFCLKKKKTPIST